MYGSVSWGLAVQGIRVRDRILHAASSPPLSGGTESLTLHPEPDTRLPRFSLPKQLFVNISGTRR